MKKKLNLEEVKTYIENEGPKSKVYIGCDSVSYKRNGQWFADYYLVVVVHKNGCNGCKIFGEVHTERDWIPDRKRPRYRLMMEVYKTAELFIALSEAIGEKEVEVHLDLNPDKRYASSIVVNEAIGYIRATCNVIPFVKPESWVATHAADKMIRNRR